MAPTPEQVKQMSTGATPLQVAGVTDTTPTPTAASPTETPGALSGYPTPGVSAPLSDQLRNFTPIAASASWYSHSSGKERRYIGSGNS